MQIKTKHNVVFASLWVMLLLLNFFMIRQALPRSVERIKQVADDPDTAVLLDTKFLGFSQADASDALTAMGVEGREQYIRFHQREDLVFPFAYGIFLALTLFLLARTNFHKPKLPLYIASIPILAMLSDLAENYHIMQFVKQFPALQSNTVLLASLANSAKWVLVIISLFACVVLLAIFVFKKFIKPGKPYNS